MNPRWQAARREILYLALAGMDICFLVPMVLALSHFTVRLPPGRAALTFFVVVLLAFYLVRLLDALNFKEQVQRDVALGFLFLWILLALRFTLYRHYPLFSLGWLGEMAGHVNDSKLWPQDVTIIVITLVFWWRGLKLAQRSLNVNAIGHYFRSGVLVMAVAVGLVSQTLDWSSTPFVFSYFFLSLMAIALARAEEVGRWRAGIPFPFSAGWLLSIAAAAIAVILIAVGLIALFTGENILQALALMGPIWEILRRVLLIVVSILFAILYPILQFLVSRLSALLTDSGVELRPALPAEELFIRPGEFVVEPSAFGPYQPILRVLAVLGGVLIVAFAFGRMWRARNRLGQAQTEPAWGERKPGEGLAGRARQGLETLLGRLNFINRWRTAVSIRRIYAQMVALATRRGYPRAGSETPYEYLPTLAEVWPEMGPQLETITQAYAQVHYGEYPETKEELEAIRAAWEMIRSVSGG